MKKLKLNISELFTIFKLLWHYLRRHKALFVISMVLIFIHSIFLGGALSFILPILGQLFSSESALNEGTGFFAEVIRFYKGFTTSSEHKELVPVILLFVFMLLYSVFQFIIVLVHSNLTKIVTCDCRKEIYQAINKLRYDELSKDVPGTYIQFAVSETRSVNNVFQLGLALITKSINSIVIIILLFLLSWQLTLILVIILLNIFDSTVLTRYIRKLADKAILLRTKLMDIITEGILGIKQLRILIADVFFQKKVDDTSYRSEDSMRSIRVFSELLAIISQSISGLGVIVIILIWAFIPVFNTAIPKSIGIITFIMLISRLSPIISVISGSYGTFIANIPALNKINFFLKSHNLTEKSGNYKPKFFLKRDIQFKDVSFEYLKERPVIQNVTLSISRGDYIGLVGSSGSGKTTFLNLLIRLYDPMKGSIRIDGKDLHKLSLSYLRSHISMVTQDYFLFNLSIRENLMLAKPEATDEELLSILEKVGLKSFMDSLDQGLDTQIGSNGSKLSGGQRQRLSLAIVLLRDSQIIILDEGTSSVDKKTEKYILQSIKKLNQDGKTIISCSHQDSALIDARKIYEIQDGNFMRISRRVLK